MRKDSTNGQCKKEIRDKHNILTGITIYIWSIRRRGEGMAQMLAGRSENIVKMSKYTMNL